MTPGNRDRRPCRLMPTCSRIRDLACCSALGAVADAAARHGARARRRASCWPSIALGLLRVATCRGWATGSADGVFCILAAVTVVVGRRRRSRSAIRSTAPSGSALSLLGTAGLFLLQGAQFLAVATIVVYAGAILVTFLFVLMLAQPEGKASYDRVSWEALLSAVDRRGDGGRAVDDHGRRVSNRRRRRRPIRRARRGWPSKTSWPTEHVAHLGGELFSRHLIAVEVAGTLLLVALVGAAAIVAPERKIANAGARPAEATAHERSRHCCTTT